MCAPQAMLRIVEEETRADWAASEAAVSSREKSGLKDPSANRAY
jgi:hypothetical protein